MPKIYKKPLIQVSSPSDVSNQFNPKKLVALDTETLGLKIWKDDIPFAVSMCDEEGNTWYAEWFIDPFTRQIDWTKTSREEFDRDVEFIRYYCSDKFENILHNRPYDRHMLKKIGIELVGITHDTGVSARVVSNIEMSYGLKELSTKYLGIKDDDRTELGSLVQSCRRKATVYNRRAKKIPGTRLMKLGEDYHEDYWLPRYYDPNDRTCQKYAELDVIRTMGLWLLHLQMFEEDPILEKAYWEEWELYPEIDSIEDRGMRIDPDTVKSEHNRAKIAMKSHLDAMIKIIKDNNLQPWDLNKIRKAHQEKVDAVLLRQSKMKSKTSNLRMPELILPDIRDFNPDSPPQLQRILFLPKGKGGLGLYTKRTTKTGMSTDKHTLRELMSEEFVRHLTFYRTAGQAIDLFFESYGDLAVEESPGCFVLRPNVNQLGASKTGRLSSNNPNLMQVTNIKTASANFGSYQIRSIFIPRDGYDIYTGDYKQQELRIFSDVAQIPFLLNEIREGRDPNSSVTNRIWGGKNNPAAIKAATLALEFGLEAPSSQLVSDTWDKLGWGEFDSSQLGMSSAKAQRCAGEWLSWFDHEIVRAEASLDKSGSRGRAKCVVFAVVYGGGASSITELLYCTLNEAKSFMKDMHRAIPEIKMYMDRQIEIARRDGFIINPYGRKLRIERDFAYRAVNYGIQSCGACLVKHAIKSCNAYFRDMGLDARVLMPIHDEIILEIRKGHDEPWVLRAIIEMMSDTTGSTLKIPMTVDLKKVVGSWDNKISIAV